MTNETPLKNLQVPKRQRPLTGLSGGSLLRGMLIADALSGATQSNSGKKSKKKFKQPWRN